MGYGMVYNIAYNKQHKGMYVAGVESKGGSESSGGICLGHVSCKKFEAWCCKGFALEPKP